MSYSNRADHNKRFFLRFFLFALIIGWLSVGLVSDSLKAENQKPNLLIIQTDEHHYNTLGCYGGKIVETTHIDWLAKQGAICTSFYATTPVCSPSRASFVSGLYPQKTPVVTNNIPLDDGVVTFAELLNQKGYTTGFCGKWHLNGSGKPEWAPARKFGFEDNRFMFNRGHWKKFAMGKDGPQVAARNQRGQPSYGVDDADKKSFSTDFLVDRAIDFIKLNSETPFCYYISLPDPHGPNTVRKPYDTMYAGVRVPIPSTIKKEASEIPKWAKPAKVTPTQLRKIMPNYYGMVKCIDDNIGRLIGTLRETGVLGNTMIVFTSDHGDLCGEHGRLNKGVPYEGSARIPFIVFYPEQVPAGTRIDAAMTCVDFFPTMMDLLGHKHNRIFDGRNAAPFFRKQKNADWKDVAFMRSNAWVTAVTDRYKLVLSVSDEPWLFDLENDPDERKNHYKKDDYKEIVRKLKSEISTYLKSMKDPLDNENVIKKWLN